jgi:PHD/YefM family antitoxin component YafN of YafNO toxin-antitoxin module
MIGPPRKSQRRRTQCLRPPNRSLTDFQRGAPELIERLKETRRPEVLTTDGEGEVMVQDAEAYQELLDKLDRAEAIVGIQRGLASMRRGEGVPAKAALDRLRSELGAWRTDQSEPIKPGTIL